MKNAIVLCSGGLDSVVTAYFVKKLGYKKIIILFFNYGQNSFLAEKKCTKKTSTILNAQFKSIKLDLSCLTSPLTAKKFKFNLIKNKSLRNTKKESNKWYLPARNLIFLAYAISLSEFLYLKEKKIYNIFVGFKCEGLEFYPDATLPFIKKINELNTLILKNKSKIYAPLIEKDKEDIILLGNKLNVNFNNTFSCYASSSMHCGSCLACRLRKAGFYWACIKDPTKYGA